MNDAEIKQKLYELIKSCAPSSGSVKSIEPGMTLRKDLGFDSVQTLLLMFKFEEEFGLQLPAQSLPNGAMTTVGELVERGCAAVKGAH